MSDNLPLQTLVQMHRSQNIIEWGNLQTSVFPPEPFIADTGLPQFIRDRESLNPYEAFNLLITDDILNHMLFQTNLYAEQQYQVSAKPYKKAEMDEIKTFLGINILMGQKKYPSYRDHWSTSPDLHDPYISQVMTLHRFGWFLTNFHLNDNSVIPERSSINYDKLYKLRPFLDSLKNNFQLCLQPHENIAVDESMI
ncbi:piggyBac transposable element-derived protein 4-like [Harmonia axyridis]|uniref:piggyBac transposable element-derived protein 4-like n=1 Tax=Harmonia axyridis TaxID=115357 RepID=UPI001E27823E|nr:piggyBac transposable element-derived protein 4-like [Harmonia axyridis]